MFSVRSPVPELQAGMPRAEVRQEGDITDTPTEHHPVESACQHPLMGIIGSGQAVDEDVLQESPFEEAIAHCATAQGDVAEDGPLGGVLDGPDPAAEKLITIEFPALDHRSRTRAQGSGASR
ncbi:hypothetical protein AQJ64_42975 [Streptomyces griseoruber]|uniref:Uncharacterized protein n=1 Tax=Streptomyces griseoruber TaxID=1943 RepID=A0A117R7E7_9ACTN|nr:hypothetical protein AQJ64_42975 [Streptomyces griseoruber]